MVNEEGKKTLVPLRISVGNAILCEGENTLPNYECELSTSFAGEPIIYNPNNNKMFTMTWDELIDKAIEEGILKED
jgi:hypothetical protein